MISSSAVARAAAAALLGMLLAGCAAVEPRAPEDIVAERAQARWDALLAKDVETAYQYYSPGFRSGVSEKSLRSRLFGPRVEWKEVELREVTCSGDLCHPVFVVTYDFRSPTPRVGTIESATRLEEDWIRVDGDWFYAPAEQ